MSKANAFCEKCKKDGYFKLGTCKACRSIPCSICGANMFKKFEGHKLCHRCEKLKKDRFNRLGE